VARRSTNTPCITQRTRRTRRAAERTRRKTWQPVREAEYFPHWGAFYLMLIRKRKLCGPQRSPRPLRRKGTGRFSDVSCIPSSAAPRVIPFPPIEVQGFMLLNTHSISSPDGTDPKISIRAVYFGFLPGGWTKSPSLRICDLQFRKRGGLKHRVEH
jgi:hypothetical protein